MKKTYCLIFIFAFLGLSLTAQDYRPIDGHGTNEDHPEWGSDGQPMLRPSGFQYSDGIAAPTGQDRPNPRAISNALFAQAGSIGTKMQLSDFVWVFGQFIDHDITFVPDNHAELIRIPVPKGDPAFDPMGTGEAYIPMFRSLSVPGTGTDTSNPRNQFNAITAYIDGSAVYGSSQARADWLRTFSNGKLKTSSGNLLPWNTTTAEYNAPLDPNAPVMDNPIGQTDKLFVAGDVRANENVLLLAMHTLFVREHNRICDQLAREHPSWNDERLYQKARSMVIGIIQSIVYNEWLPAMGIHLDDPSGYDPTVNPGISNVFSAAAFRLGHTMLSSTIKRLNGEGNPIPQGHLTLREAYFNPQLIPLGGGIEPLFKGMGTQVQQSMDCKVIDDVRNFLFGAPGQGGLDLVSINIMRGRERGLPSYNSIRQSFGLDSVASFDAITSDPSMFFPLSEIYGEVDKVDPWVGMLAEDHLPDAVVGPTIMNILKDQFSRIRAGDRFYFEWNDHLSQEEKKRIRNTTMHDILMRNTSLELMQKEVFLAKDHEDIPKAKVDLVERDLEIVAYPNPFVTETHIKFYSREETAGVIRLIDPLGREVIREEMMFEKGTNGFNLELDHTRNDGMYILMIKNDRKFHTHKLYKVSDQP